jgi:hypothetical protein
MMGLFNEIISYNFLKKNIAFMIVKKRIKIWSLLIICSSILMVLSLYHSPSIKLTFDKHIDQRIKNHWHFSMSEKCISLVDLFNIPLQIEKWTSEKPESIGTLVLSKKDQEKIKEQAKLLMEHKGNSKVKKWIKTLFVTAEKDTIKIKLKIHGTSPLHYSSSYKSFKISSPKPINGFTHFSLIREDDLNPLITVGNYIADSIGLIAPKTHFVTIHVNKKEYNYAQLEDVDEIISSQGFEVYRNINERNRLEYVMTGDPHISRWDLSIAHIKKVNDLKYEDGLAKYDEISNTYLSDTFAVDKFFNTEYIGKYLAIAYLFNDVHFMIGHNLRLAYNRRDSLFYPIFRIETVGKKVIADYYESRFPFLNTWLFMTSPTRGESTLGILWQKLLNDPEVRYYRDLTIQEFSSHGSLKKGVIHYVNKNDWFVTSSVAYGKTMRNSVINQQQNIDWLLKKHQKYCAYTKIFEYVKGDTLRVISDALIDVLAINQGDTIIIPARLHNLLPTNGVFELPVKNYHYVNRITGDKVIPQSKAVE